MIQLSDRLLQMEESATIAMAKKARELKANGKDVISLSLGEPDFNTPDFIKKSAEKAISENYSKYTPVSGYQELREAVSLKFKRDNNLSYSPSQIVVSTGAKQSIANVVLSLINPGDEVIIPAPYWVSYIEIVKVAGGIPKIINTDIQTDFKISSHQLENSINKKSKMIIFSSPCNPTGSMYSKEELQSIAEVIKKHPNIVAVSDEIYEHINFTGKHESLAQFSNIYDQVVTVNGLSKAWAMTGWRLGYIGASQKIASSCDKVQGQFTSATCSITQRAAISALLEDPIVLKDMNQAFFNRRKLVFEKLCSIPGIQTNLPQGAFYFFPDCSAYFGKNANGKTIKNSDDFCMYLLEEALVAVVAGSAFGSPNCFRISYAASEEILSEALNRIKSALKNIF